MTSDNRKDWFTERNLTPKQIKALEACISRESAKVLFGGAGFAGKSYLLRSASVFFAAMLAQLGFPGQTGMLVCSNYPSLKDRHFKALEQELGHLGRIRQGHRLYGLCFEFYDPALGALRLRNATDSEGYRGVENAYVLIDELTELPEEIISDLMYTLRSDKPLPFRPLLTGSNPDGVGYQWVKKLWIDRDFNATKYNPADFFFVQALPTDNPTFDVSNYLETLSQLPEWKKNARLYGSWDVPAGARFPQLKADIHKFKFEKIFPYGIQSHHEIILGVDWGLRDPYCCLWICRLDGDYYVYREDYVTDCPTEKQAERIKRFTGASETTRAVYVDRQMTERRRDINTATYQPSPLSVFAASFKEDPRFPLLVPAYKGLRSHAFDSIARMLTPDNGYPNLYIEERCLNLWSELQGAVWSKKGKEDIADSNPDHAMAALYYAVLTHNNAKESTRISIEEYTPDVWAQEYDKHLRKQEERFLRASTRGRGSIFARR